MIELLEHSSSSYAPRTYHNAAQGVTLAYAVDHSTAGEKCTQKAAKGKIVYGGPSDEEGLIQTARDLYRMLRHYNCHTVNVAGNGIYTFHKHGIDQATVDSDIALIIHTVACHWEIERIVSGGQTGADIAGLKAAVKMDIPCTGMWPKGFKMRFSNGRDVNMTREQIMEIINAK